MAEQLAVAGAHVVAIGRNTSALNDLRASLDPHHVSTDTVDVRDAGALERAVARAAADHGRLDLMYNGAGFGLLGFYEETPLEKWEQVFATNLRGLVHGVHAAYPIMRRQRFGHIVNVASLAGLVPIPASAVYTAAKHAVVGLSQSLRLDARRFGVRVSVVCPAAVDTPIFEESRSHYINFDVPKVLASSPPGGVLKPEECARQILKGIRKNKSVIAPGTAGMIWRLYRYAPALWDWLVRPMSRSLDEAHIPPKSNEDGTI